MNAGALTMNVLKPWAGVPVLAAILLLTACASLEGEDYAVYDTNPEFNRISFKFSENMDRRFVAPLARTYQQAVPGFMEAGVSNFFSNLRSVDSSVNGFLQGKPESGGTDLTRFLFNSTVGLAGLFDVATPAGLSDQGEDLGQTLAVWGWKKSRYVYVPLVGPSMVRDLPSMFLRALGPRFVLGSRHRFWISGVDVISTRANVLGLTDARDAAALDPYIFTREAYYQRREFLIYDGEPPLDDFDDFFDEADTGK